MYWLRESAKDEIRWLASEHLHLLVKSEHAWQAAEKWIPCQSMLGFFPFTFWVWVSGWYARRAARLERRINQLGAD